MSDPLNLEIETNRRDPFTPRPEDETLAELTFTTSSNAESAPDGPAADADGSPEPFSWRVDAPTASDDNAVRGTHEDG